MEGESGESTDDSDDDLLPFISVNSVTTNSRSTITTPSLTLHNQPQSPFHNPEISLAISSKPPRWVFLTTQLNPLFIYDIISQSVTPYFSIVQQLTQISRLLFLTITIFKYFTTVEPVKSHVEEIGPSITSSTNAIYATTKATMTSMVSTSDESKSSTKETAMSWNCFMEKMRMLMCQLVSSKPRFITYTNTVGCYDLVLFIKLLQGRYQLGIHCGHMGLRVGSEIFGIFMMGDQANKTVVILLDHKYCVTDYQSMISEEDGWYRDDTKPENRFDSVLTRSQTQQVPNCDDTVTTCSRKPSVVFRYMCQQHNFIFLATRNSHHEEKQNLYISNPTRGTHFCLVLQLWFFSSNTNSGTWQRIRLLHVFFFRGHVIRGFSRLRLTAVRYWVHLKFWGSLFDKLVIIHVCFTQWVLRLISGLGFSVVVTCGACAIGSLVSKFLVLQLCKNKTPGASVIDLLPPHLIRKDYASLGNMGVLEVFSFQEWDQLCLTSHGYNWELVMDLARPDGTILLSVEVEAAFGFSVGNAPGVLLVWDLEFLVHITMKFVWFFCLSLAYVDTAPFLRMMCFKLGGG